MGKTRQIKLKGEMMKYFIGVIALSAVLFSPIVASACSTRRVIVRQTIPVVNVETFAPHSNLVDAVRVRQVRGVNRNQRVIQDRFGRVFVQDRRGRLRQVNRRQIIQNRRGQVVFRDRFGRLIQQDQFGRQRIVRQRNGFARRGLFGNVFRNNLGFGRRGLGLGQQGLGFGQRFLQLRLLGFNRSDAGRFSLLGSLFGGGF